MATQHKDIPEAQLHEPKGASTATIGTHYVSNGAGSGTWLMEPYGWIYFENIATPYTLTYPSSYTKLSPTTVQPGNSYQVTEGTNARLTYAASISRVMDITVHISIDQAAGANRDIELALYKNGSIISGSKGITTTSSTMKQSLTSRAVTSLSNGDYIEAYIKNNGASGDINVYTFYLEVDPH